jgi:hypothetical protein
MEEQAIPTVATLDCPICKASVPADAKFCSSCGYPIGGTEWDKNEFDYAYEVKRYELTKAREKISTGVTILYVLAGLIFLVNGAFYIGDKDIAYLLTAIIVPAIFLALAWWSKTKPFTAMVVALVFYVTMLLATAFTEHLSALRGIIIKVVVIGALIKAVRGGREAQNIMKELEERNWNQ